ncbi:DUF805 domain-containing protein [Sinomonas atrocyanea]|uniref:DUF805 domain-containing protein n=1 Tax=Sinomonas atrocyanea TaxID=37927 RepID=UPI003D963BF5
MSSPQYPNPQYQAPQYPNPTPASFAAAPPLWAPHYGISFRDAIRRFFAKYATFTGRAGRGEYWWWVLASVIVSIILQVVITAGTSYDAYGRPVPGPVAILGYILVAAFTLATLVPSIAVTVRRLHDVNLSGWLALVALVPFLGPIAVLVMVLLPSNPAGQRFDRPTAGGYKA